MDGALLFLAQKPIIRIEFLTQKPRKKHGKKPVKKPHKVKKRKEKNILTARNHDAMFSHRGCAVSGRS